MTISRKKLVHAEKSLRAKKHTLIKDVIKQKPQTNKKM